MARRNDVMIDYFAKAMLRNNPKAQNINFDDFVIGDKNAIALPLKIAADILPIATDLHGHLFINNTGLEFLCSDDPVVLHNKYCEGVDYQGVNGWDSRGLQVFWPISPKALIALYDPIVYKFGTRRSSITKITSNPDIEEFNGLQILNALNNIYFATAEQGDQVKAHYAKLAIKRTTKRVRFVETETVKVEGEKESSIIGTYVPLLPINLSITCIRIKKDARKISLHERARQTRHDYPHDGTPKSGKTITYPVKSIVTK